MELRTRRAARATAAPRGGCCSIPQVDLLDHAGRHENPRALAVLPSHGSVLCKSPTLGPIKYCTHGLACTRLAFEWGCAACRRTPRHARRKNAGRLGDPAGHLAADL